MAENKAQIIGTLGEVFQMMAPYAGGSIPADTNPEYDNWRRWVQLGQQDAANRGFWGRTLDKTTVTITANDDTLTLPDNFFKRNGIYVLNVSGVDWNQANNEDSQKLHVYVDPADGLWKVRFTEIPTATVADAELWYFYNPPVPVDENDPLTLDGEMIGYYALKEYFRKTRQFGSLDDARIEYENRREELLALEVMPSPQEIMSWSPYYRHLNQKANESQFYLGRTARRRGR